MSLHTCSYVQVVVILPNVVFKTDPAGSPARPRGQVIFDLVNRGDLTPATVAASVTYQIWTALLSQGCCTVS